MEEKYCLQRHLAAFYRQSRCGERADFAEPCKACKYIESCRCNWMTLLLPSMPEDIEFWLSSPMPDGMRDRSRIHPEKYNYQDRHSESW